MKDYMSIQELLGVHPNVYIDLLSRQRRILLDRFKDLKNKGKVSEEEYNSLIKLLSKMSVDVLPYLPNPKKDE